MGMDMTSAQWTRTALLGTGLLLSACAGSRRPPENASAARIKDSAPEKLAAQRAATPGLEDEDARWGIGAAQERKRQRDEKNEQRRKAAGTTDIRATPTVGIAPVPPKP
jgi:hypothetical protein